MMRERLLKYRVLFGAVLALLVVVGGLAQITGVPLGSLSLAIGDTNSVTVAKTGSGAVEEVGSAPAIRCGPVCTSSYPAGTVVVLKAIPQTGMQAAWVDCPEQSNDGTMCKVTATGAKKVGVIFGAPVTLRMVVNGLGSALVYVNGEKSAAFNSCVPKDQEQKRCSGTIVDGSQVTLRSESADGWGFSAWQGPCTGSADCTFTAGNTNVLATFMKHNVEVRPVHGGLIYTSAGVTPKLECNGGTKTLCSAYFPAGTVVKVEMKDLPSGKQFGFWDGYCGTNPICTFTVPGGTGTYSAYSYLYASNATLVTLTIPSPPPTGASLFLYSNGDLAPELTCTTTVPCGSVKVVKGTRMTANVSIHDTAKNSLQQWVNAPSPAPSNPCNGQKTNVCNFTANGNGTFAVEIGGPAPAPEPSDSITAITVITGPNDRIKCPDYYFRVEQDLNENVSGSDYVYLCTRYGPKSEALTDLRILNIGTWQHDLIPSMAAIGEYHEGYQADDPVVNHAYLKITNFHDPDHMFEYYYSTIYCSGGSGAIEHERDRVSVDLNKGAGGDVIYFCTSKKTADGAPLKDVTFSRWQNTTPSASTMCGASAVGSAGWTPAKQDSNSQEDNLDLNAGASGRYIYTCLKR